MLLHDFELFLRQLARLLQNLDRNKALPDIMQNRSHPKRRQLITVIPFSNTEQRRIDTDIQRMLI
ncbi:hypothetical protein D3C84_1170880 [compost metagenome]